MWVIFVPFCHDTSMTHVDHTTLNILLSSRISNLVLIWFQSALTCSCQCHNSMWPLHTHWLYHGGSRVKEQGRCLPAPVPAEWTHKCLLLHHHMHTLSQQTLEWWLEALETHSLLHRSGLKASGWGKTVPSRFAKEAMYATVLSFGILKPSMLHSYTRQHGRWRNIYHKTNSEWVHQTVDECQGFLPNSPDSQ